MQPYHILVCEQNADHAELLVYNLKKAGYHPTVLASDEILSHAAQRKPHMVILGSTTDDQEKRRIGKAIKENPKLGHTLVLCLTTNDFSNIISSPSQSFIDACLILPQKPKQIIKTIGNLFTQFATPLIPVFNLDS